MGPVVLANAAVTSVGMMEGDDESLSELEDEDAQEYILNEKEVGIMDHVVYCVEHIMEYSVCVYMLGTKYGFAQSTVCAPWISCAIHGSRISKGAKYKLADSGQRTIHGLRCANN